MRNLFNKIGPIAAFISIFGAFQLTMASESPKRSGWREWSDPISIAVKKAGLLASQKGDWFKSELSELNLRREALISSGKDESDKEILEIDQKKRQYEVTKDYLSPKTQHQKTQYFVKKAFVEDPSLLTEQTVRDNKYNILGFFGSIDPHYIKRPQSGPSIVELVIEDYRKTCEKYSPNWPDMMTVEQFENNIVKSLLNYLKAFVAFNTTYFQYFSFFEELKRADKFIKRYDYYREIIDTGPSHEKFIEILEDLPCEIFVNESLSYCRKALIDLNTEDEILPFRIRNSDINRWIESFSGIHGFSRNLKDIVHTHFLGRKHHIHHIQQDRSKADNRAYFAAKLFEIVVADGLKEICGHEILDFEKIVYFFEPSNDRIFSRGKSIDIVTRSYKNRVAKENFIEVKMGSDIIENSSNDIVNIAELAKRCSVDFFLANSIKCKPFFCIIDLSSVYKPDEIIALVNSAIFCDARAKYRKNLMEIKASFIDGSLSLEKILRLNENAYSYLSLDVQGYRDCLIEFYKILDKFRDVTIRCGKSGEAIPIFNIDSIKLNFAKNVKNCCLEKSDEYFKAREHMMLAPLDYVKSEQFAFDIQIIRDFFDDKIKLGDSQIMHILQKLSPVFSDLSSKIALKLLKDFLNIVPYFAKYEGFNKETWSEYEIMFSGIDGFNEIIVEIAKIIFALDFNERAFNSKLTLLNYASHLLARGEKIQRFNSIECALRGDSAFYSASIDIITEKDGVVKMHVLDDLNNSYRLDRISDIAGLKKIELTRVGVGDFNEIAKVSDIKLVNPADIIGEIIDKPERDAIRRMGLRPDVVEKFIQYYNSIDQLLPHVQDILVDGRNIKTNMKKMFDNNAIIFMESGSDDQEAAFSLSDLDNTYKIMSDYPSNLRILRLFFNGDPYNSLAGKFDYTNRRFVELFNMISPKLMPILVKDNSIKLVRDLIRKTELSSFCDLNRSVLSDWNWDKCVEALEDVDGFTEAVHKIAKYLLNFYTGRIEESKLEEIRNEISYLEKTYSMIDQSDSSSTAAVAPDVKLDGMSDRRLIWEAQPIKPRNSLSCKLFSIYDSRVKFTKLDFIDLYMDESFTEENIAGLEKIIFNILPIKDDFKTDFEFHYDKIYKNLELVSEVPGILEKTNVKLRMAKIFKEALGLFIKSPSFDFNSYFKYVGLYNMSEFLDSSDFERRFGLLKDFINGKRYHIDPEFMCVFSDLSSEVLPGMVGELSLEVVKSLASGRLGMDVSIDLGSAGTLALSDLVCYFERFNKTEGYADLAYNITKKLVKVSRLNELSDADRSDISNNLKKLQKAYNLQARGKKILSFDSQEYSFDGRVFNCETVDIKCESSEWQDSFTTPGPIDPSPYLVLKIAHYIDKKRGGFNGLTEVLSCKNRDLKGMRHVIRSLEDDKITTLG